ncbi:MAG: peptide ABC transporter substrate-binding protein [Chloroflexi bacterium]|nr:MAG: peptide ABC transporter substrate-binding protein [Chloroflexota bacterium]
MGAALSGGGRWRGLLVALASALLVATACTTPPSGASPTTGASASASAVARGGGGTLHILYWQAPTILNTHKAQGTKDYDAGGLILEPLAKFGPDAKPVPFLASEIPTLQNGGIAADLKSITWKLKQNVKWSDGTDFTADDVVFTWQYVADEKTAASDSETVLGVSKVEAVDKNTVKVSFTDPNPNPYQIFVTGLGNIIQKKQFQSCIGAAAETCAENNKPVGTGPYKLVDFKPGDVVTYTINDSYRDPGKPFFKDVQIKGVADAATAARSVCQAGDSDYGWNMQIEWSILSQIVSGGKCVMVTHDSPNVERILVNRADPSASLGDKRSEPTTQHPFLSDLNVRKALAMAIDRKTLATQLYNETGKATCNIVTAPAEVNSPNTASADICQFDATKAGQLLDQAGWTKAADGKRAKGGKQMVINYLTSTNDLRQKEQAIVKQNWEALGITVNLKNVPASVFFSSDAGNPDTAAHMYYDVEMYTNGSSDPDQQNYLSGWLCNQIAQKSNQWKGNNYERYCSTQYDNLFAQYKKELDKTKRSQLAIQLNDMLVNDVVIIPLVARAFPVASASKDLKGLNGTPWESDLWNIQEWYK